MLSLRINVDLNTLEITWESQNHINRIIWRMPANVREILRSDPINHGIILFPLNGCSLSDYRRGSLQIMDESTKSRWTQVTFSKWHLVVSDRRHFLEDKWWTKVGLFTSSSNATQIFFRIDRVKSIGLGTYWMFLPK